jgi:2-(1,2-epoxy-1,2-dihydrophenyl)acetyl-CoA isomerase
MWAALQSALHTASSDTSLRVLVLGAEGEDFSVGADIGGGADTADAALPSHRDQLQRMQWIQSIVGDLYALAVPTIARVDGLAVGVGMNLALCCDFVVATERARFSEIFIRRALSVDGGGSWLLPRQIGIHRAKRLCLLGEMIGANEAFDLGLVTYLCAPQDLDSTVEDLVAKLAEKSPAALSHTKALLNAALSSTFDAALEGEARVQALNVAGDDFTSAVAEFAAKTQTSAERQPT